jgi:hypothetical protein
MTGVVSATYALISPGAKVSAVCGEMTEMHEFKKKILNKKPKKFLFILMTLNFYKINHQIIDDLVNDVQFAVRTSGEKIHPNSFEC